MSEKARLGVVAVVPFWSQSDNLNVDSNYAYLRIVLPEMERETEDTLFLVFFPDPHYGSDRWVYTPDGLQSSRIRFIPWHYDTQMSSSVVGFDNARFKEIETQCAPTIYWLHQVESGPALAGGYTNGYGVGIRPTLIAQHHYIIHRSLPYVYESQFRRQWMQIGGSLASDAVLYNSQYCKRMADESFSEILNSSKMAELEAKSAVLPFGLLTGSEPIAPEATSADRPVVIYNHRFEYYKRPDITFALLDELKAEFKFEVYATQTAGQASGGKRGYFYDKSVFAPSREQYLANIAVPAINTINSTHETFCISALDSLALGHLLVAPRALTFPELVPPDYPFLFESEAEQKEMLHGILSTWPEEYNRWRIPLSSYAREHFKLSDYVSRYLSRMAAEEGKHRDTNRKERTIEGLNTVFDAFEAGKLYAVADIRNKVVKSIHTKGSATQSMPARRIVREALALREDIGVTWSGGVKLYKKQ